MVRAARGSMLVVALASMTYGVWLGLVRLGWALPLAWPDQLLLHGPLMIGGFLGTLVGLERAIGIARRWAYAAPVCTSAGALLLVASPSPLPGAALIAIGSAVVVIVFVVVVRRQPSLFALTMLAGAVCWAAGSAAWAGGAPIHRVVFWWIDFIVLTIAGERLELNRLLRPSSMVRAAFVGALLIMVAGSALLASEISGGAALAGAGLLLAAAWLARNDVARRTIRQRGLTRYMAVCLVGGYVWLGVAGALLLTQPLTASGSTYDAVLHATFVGFVLPMIFGHAPIVLPAVLRARFRYHAALYVPVALVHVSLVLRVTGDLADALGRLRGWGALGNASAILLFASIVAASNAVARPQHDRAAV
jgi:hypothetical protein